MNGSWSSSLVTDFTPEAEPATHLLYFTSSDTIFESQINSSISRVLQQVSRVRHRGADHDTSLHTEVFEGSSSRALTGRLAHGHELDEFKSGGGIADRKSLCSSGSVLGVHRMW